MKMSTKFFLALLQIVWLKGICMGSRLSFTKHSERDKTLISPLQLNCSFQKSGDYYPVSMYILKGSSTILASMSQPHKTVMRSKKGDVHIQGTLSNSSLSYLTATWQRPAETETGMYVCYAHARDSIERDTLFQSTLNVRLVEPTFSEMLHFSSKQAALNEDQGSRLVELSAQLKFLQESLGNNSEEIAVTKTQLASLQPRVEEGTVACGNSNNFKLLRPNTGHCLPFRESVNFVSFKTPYPKSPSVMLNLEFIDVHTGINTRFYYYKKNITPYGFELACGTWCDTLLNAISIHWRATNS